MAWSRGCLYAMHMLCLVLQTWYKSIMPLYFPRSKAEVLYAAMALPLDLGDEFGEPIIPERKIRISVNPLKGVFFFFFFLLGLM